MVLGSLRVMDKMVLDLLTMVGAYQGRAMKEKRYGKDTTTHISEVVCLPSYITT